MASREQDRSRVAALIEQHGRTFADESGITLCDKPSPLWQLLVLASLLAARISSDIALAAARELFRAGYRTPRRMRDATWQQRVDALVRGHYRRYDESTATRLGDMADTVLKRYRGDLRRMHEESGNLARDLQQFKGIGPTGAAIFLREVQGVWPDVAPFVDKVASSGARKLGLPAGAEDLAALVSTEDLPRLVAACVRADRDRTLVDDFRAR